MSVWFNGVSCVCFNFTLTSLFLRDGFDLNAITGGSGNISFRVGLCFISFQCFLNACLILFVASQNCVTNTSF